jgi:hypothetical protein
MLSVFCDQSFMPSDAIPFPAPAPFASPTPKPGEIWSLRRTLHSPSPNTESEPYSDPAQRFLRGEFPDHYAMIVKVLAPEIDPEEAWQTVSVMVLSAQTEYLSDVDILIPATVSGMSQDLVAETWHVLPMLGCNLQQPTGARFPRAIYDQLMTIGDRPLTLFSPNTQAFHQQEIAWSDVLSIPFAAYQTYLRSLQWANVLLTQTLQAEQSIQSLTLTPINPNRAVQLSRWFQGVFEPAWVAIETLTSTETLHLAIATRQSEETNAAEVTELLRLLESEQSEIQRRRLLKQLGELAKGNSEAIAALTRLLRSTQDDETLWAAVESLWQIDPGNPLAGVRRVRLIDLGLQVAARTVALAVAMIPRPDQRIGVMLRVYPTGDEPFVPEELKLILSDSSQRSYEVSARRNDLYIQLKFNGHRGEAFSVQVSLGEAFIVENFVM